MPQAARFLFCVGCVLIKISLLPQNMDFQEKYAMRPTAGDWARHIVLFLITFITATMAGVFYPFGRHGSPLFLLETFFDSYEKLIFLPFIFPYLFMMSLNLIFSDARLIGEGLMFSIPLLIILTAHEFGHYIACRIYGVDATLPYFMPVPLISPAGTFGAFIKILSPMPSRKATFDIGVAGPIAGFVALIPVAITAVLTMPRLSPEQLAASQSDLYFTDPLLIRFFAALTGTDLTSSVPNGFYFATWVGLLITSLNLVPAGQLDGGHAVFAVFGGKIHNLTGKIAFALMVIMTFTGWFVFNSPSGVLFTVILGVMLLIKHPEPLDDTPLDFKRKMIAFLTLLIFILSFMPFPIRVAE